jgi:hypothetical protein
MCILIATLIRKHKSSTTSHNSTIGTVTN